MKGIINEAKKNVSKDSYWIVANNYQCRTNDLLTRILSFKFFKESFSETIYFDIIIRLKFSQITEIINIYNYQLSIFQYSRL